MSAFGHVIVDGIRLEIVGMELRPGGMLLRAATGRPVSAGRGFPTVFTPAGEGVTQVATEVSWDAASGGMSLDLSLDFLFSVTREEGRNLRITRSEP